MSQNKIGFINRWPADKVERRKITDLIPYARNARTHSDAQVAQIAASINEWGWTTPVLIDESGQIIAGHGRIMAARKLGIDQVPVMVASGWSDAQKKAYVLADNQLTINAGWDMDLLKIELGDLETGGFNLDLIGFDDNVLAEILADKTKGLTDPDETPEVPVQPVSVSGDVWVLGNHRIICGDSTSADVVGKLLGPVKPHLMVTDPPYGVNYDPDWRNRSSIGWSQSRSTGLVANDDRADWRDAYALFPGDVAYVWHPPGARQVEFFNSLVACEFDIRMQIIWAKPHFPIGRGNYHVQHEPCWYAVRKGATAHWQGDRKQTTLWQIDNFSARGGGNRAGAEDRKTGHGTQKPVECMKRPIENNSSPGQAVYEPFSGSGTTIIAGEMTGRHVYAIELNPAYVDVAVMRWQNFTGNDAVLDNDGRTFNDVKVKRCNLDS